VTVVDDFPALARRARHDDAIAVEARRALNEIRTLQAALRNPTVSTCNDAFRRELAEVFRLVGEGIRR
jgi:hypothetical protein